MKCSIKGCPGEYDDQDIIHTVKHEEKVIVIDHVPAEVCSICGDILMSPETIRHIEALLAQNKSPSRTIPLYEYA